MKSWLLVVASMLLVAVIAVGVWAWAPDLTRADLDEKFSRPATRYIEIGGTVLRVRDTGAIDAPPLILLHGFGSSLETWEPWAVSLSVRYRVLRFDFPGCGLSEPDPSRDYGDSRSIDLIRLLMARLGISHAVVIGNSMGGRIAWRFAAAYPHLISKLILISPDGFASPGLEYGKAPEVPALFYLIKYFLPRRFVLMFLANAYAERARLTEPVVDRYYDLLRAPGNRGAALDRMRQTVLQDPIPMLKLIITPTLLVWGEKDQLIPFANSAEYLHALPHASLISFADLGHVPHEEAPDESLTPVRAFLAE